MIRLLTLLIFAQFTVPMHTGAIATSSSKVQVFSDSFPYADGDLVAVSGGNWAYNTCGSFIVTSNILSNNQLSCLGLAHWTGAGTPNNDQYSSMVFNPTIQTGELGPAVRVTAGATSSGYVADCIYGGGCRITKLLNGTQTNLTTYDGLNMGNANTVEIDVTGTTNAVITTIENGVTSQTYTDSSSPILSGTCGIAGYNNGSVVTASNVKGGNL